MFMKKPILLFCFFYLILFVFFTSNAFALSNFITDYDITYTVMTNAVTHVDFKIVLTNKSEDYYASSYNIKAGFKTLENIKAFDPNGSIIPTVKEENGEKNIELVFNKRVIGENNKLNFSLSFDTPDIVNRFGKIWEINVPGLSRGDFQSFNSHILVPSFLGNPSYIKPQVGGITGNTLHFNKDQLGKSGISIAYGDSQIYKFNLKYHLSNPNLFPVKTEISIPPSTNYQEILIDEMNPKPINVREDKDGNWLAQYSLLPSQKRDIVVKGRSRLSLTPKKEQLTKEEISGYLKEQPYWQISNEKIKNLAQNLKTPAAIYEYVVKNLKYDFSRVTEGKERLGALNVLANPNSAVCLEFTDLFVALARAAGIPAREIDGFANTQNSKERPLSLVKDILHAWPEYYDFEKETWIMVDPTWGNTTDGIDYFSVLDFDHFAFVIKGRNSSYPIPAGGYKFLDNQNTKDVEVSFSNDFNEETPLVGVEEGFLKEYPSLTTIEGKIIIRNIGKNAVDTSSLEIKSNFLKPLDQQIDVKRIPPFGFASVSVSFNKTPFLTNVDDELRIAIGQRVILKRIKIYPFFFNKFAIAGGIIFAILAIALSIIAVRSRRIPFFR